MSETDIEVSRDIEINSNPVPWTEKNFLDCLRKDYYCLVQEVDQEVSGFAIQNISLNESHLLNIGIKEMFRNRGLGQELLEQIVHASKSMGCKKIFLEVRVSNNQAIGLYNKTGFKKVSVKKNYYRLPDGREDALVMSKKT
jgi:ribosomal-protein-alanine N-acetyltransferase